MPLLGSKPSPQPMPQAAPAPSDDQQPQSIEQDREAMKLVDQLKQMGYSGDDVAQAMDQDGGPSQDQGQAATQAAPMQIPGM